MDKILDEDLAFRKQYVIDRRNEIQMALAEIEGSRLMWRVMMNKKYKLADEDEIMEDGTIIKAEIKESETSEQISPDGTDNKAGTNVENGKAEIDNVPVSAEVAEEKT